MREPTTSRIEVTYRDSEPDRLTAITKRYDGDYTYKPEYEFKVQGSTAELQSIVPDGGDKYHVRVNKCTRQAAKDAVQELPFVDEVVMIE